MDRTALKWLWSQSKSQHISMYLLIGIDVIISALGIVFALILKDLIDYATSSRPFAIYGIGLLTVVLVQYSLNAIMLYMSEKVNSQLTNQLRLNIVNSLMRSDYSEVRDNHTGEWMNRLFSDVKIVANGYTGILPDTAAMITKLLCACGALLMLEPLFFLIYLSAGAVMIIVISILRRKIKLLHKDVQSKEDKVHSFLQELLENILIIKSFHAYDHMTEKTAEYQEQYRDSRLRRRKITILANSSFSLTFRLGYVFAVIWGGYGLLDGTITYGSLMAILQLISQVQSPISRLSGVFTRVYELSASCERIMIRTETPELSGSGSVSGISEIIFDHVSFGYGPEKIIDEATFTIEKGDKVALTGISGVGKSTLFLLMMNLLIPDSGEVSIMDETGNRINTDAKQVFAYVPQGNALFSGSIAENIVFGKAYDEQRVVNVLEMANADQFVAALPEGIHTELKENGSGLSEGQIQRISIARALYSDAPVLLLDEATSALDEKTEALLLAELKRLTDKTIVIVTHRKAVLSICNKELRLNNGLAEEFSI